MTEKKLTVQEALLKQMRTNFNFRHLNPKVEHVKDSSIVEVEAKLTEENEKLAKMKATERWVKVGKPIGKIKVRGFKRPATSKGSSTSKAPSKKRGKCDLT